MLVPQSCSTLATPWTVARQAPLSMGLFRQEYRSGLSFPSPGESSQHRDQTPVSCVAGRFFYHRSYQGSPLPSSYTQHVSALKCQLLLLACKFYDLQFYFFWKKQNTLLRSEVQDPLPLDSLFCMDQATIELISLSQRSLSPSHSRGISGGSRPIPGPGGPSYGLATCRCWVWEVPVHAPDCLVQC